MISALDSFELGVTRARAASAPDVRSVAVVGLGYVGLPTALALLEAGIRVVGYDISESRLAAIKAHRVDLPDADQLRLTGCLDTGRLMLTTEASALSGVEAVVVCVPTPVDEYLVPDLVALEAACATAVAHCRPGQTIVLISTTYVGCTRDLVVRPLERRPALAHMDGYVADGHISHAEGAQIKIVIKPVQHSNFSNGRSGRSGILELDAEGQAITERRIALNEKHLLRRKKPGLTGPSRDA